MQLTIYIYIIYILYIIYKTHNALHIKSLLLNLKVDLFLGYIM